MTTTCLSEVPLPDDCIIVFDLDDTLCPERDFVLSGFRAIEAEIGQPVFDRLKELFDSDEKDAIGIVLRETNAPNSKESLIEIYRDHIPTIELAHGLHNLLTNAKNPLGLITDGRSKTQRNKLKALGIEQVFDEVVISEEFGSGKPDERNFRHFERQFPDRTYAYVGDNLRKDFITPNALGWTTICLLNRGQNIHPQNFDEVPETHLPQFRIESLVS